LNKKRGQQSTWHWQDKNSCINSSLHLRLLSFPHNSLSLSRLHFLLTSSSLLHSPVFSSFNSTTIVTIHTTQQNTGTFFHSYLIFIQCTFFLFFFFSQIYFYLQTNLFSLFSSVFHLSFYHFWISLTFLFVIFSCFSYTLFIFLQLNNQNSTWASKIIEKDPFFFIHNHFLCFLCFFCFVSIVFGFFSYYPFVTIVLNSEHNKVDQKITDKIKKKTFRTCQEMLTIT
jgi:hypothetical protein